MSAVVHPRVSGLHQMSTGRGQACERRKAGLPHMDLEYHTSKSNV